VPTRAGWSLIIAGVVLIVAGRVLGPLEFIVAGACAIAASVAAVVVRRLLPSRVAIGRAVTPGRVPAGEPARVDLEVINRNRRRSPLLRLHDSVSGTRGVRLSLAPLPGGGSARGAYRLPTTRRGILELGPVKVDDVDALGLARRTHRVDTRVRLIVHPPVEVLPAVNVPAGDDPLLGEDLRQSLGLSDEEFDGLREYAPGDDLRKVHWPSSARHDELLVRQFRPPRHGRLAVVLDTRPPGSVAEVLDVTTSIAASIASAVLDSGDATRIETTDGRSTPLASAPSQLDGLLEFLALLDGGHEQIHPAIPGGTGTVVAVTADPQLFSDPAARRRFAQRLRAAVVVTADASRWHPDTEPGHASGDWIHLTGPGQLAGFWRLGRARSPVSA
jgi:uncharacterized protein (DUF58 family)